MKFNKFANTVVALAVGITSLLNSGGSVLAKSNYNSLQQEQQVNEQQTDEQQTDEQQMAAYIPEYPDAVPDPVELIDAASIEAQPAELQLEFRILEVKALDMTNPECFLGTGKDQISLGGIALSRYGLNKIDFTNVGEFCDGDRRDFRQNPWVFTTFSLQDFFNTPSVTFVMAERDSKGGKEKFRDKLAEEEYQRVRTSVEKDLDPTELVASSLDSNNPEDFEATLKKVLRDVVKTIVEDLFKQLWDWLVSVVSGTPDDIFKPKTVTVTFESVNARWSGGVISPPAEITLSEGTGTYRIIYDWHITVSPMAMNGVDVSNNEMVNGSDVSIWGVSPWLRVAIAFQPLFWTKPGAIQSANAVNFVAYHSNKCLDVAGQDIKDGALMQQRTCINADAKSQVYSIRRMGYYYQIVANHSGKCLEVTGGSSDNGINVIQSSCATSVRKHQLWIARPVGSNFQFIAAHSGKCLEVRKDQQVMLSGAAVQQWDCLGFRQTNQLWHIALPAKPVVVPQQKVYLPLIQR